jgi:hypothetical protein
MAAGFLAVVPKLIGDVQEMNTVFNLDVAWLTVNT